MLYRHVTDPDCRCTQIQTSCRCTQLPLYQISLYRVVIVPNRHCNKLSWYPVSAVPSSQEHYRIVVVSSCCCTKFSLYRIKSSPSVKIQEEQEQEDPQQEEEQEEEEQQD